MAELLLGTPIFPGDSGVDQLVEIIKVLGTPTREQIREMNPNYTEFKFPQIKPHPWTKVCSGGSTYHTHWGHRILLQLGMVSATPPSASPCSGVQGSYTSGGD